MQFYIQCAARYVHHGPALSFTGVLHKRKQQANITKVTADRCTQTLLFPVAVFTASTTTCMISLWLVSIPNRTCSWHSVSVCLSATDQVGMPSQTGFSVRLPNGGETGVTTGAHWPIEILMSSKPRTHFNLLCHVALCAGCSSNSDCPAGNCCCDNVCVPSQGITCDVICDNESCKKEDLTKTCACIANCGGGTACNAAGGNPCSRSGGVCCCGAEPFGDVCTSCTVACNEARPCTGNFPLLEADICTTAPP